MGALHSPFSAVTILEGILAMQPMVLWGLQGVVKALESVHEKSCSQGIHCSRTARFIQVLSQIGPGSARVAHATRSRLDYLDKSSACAGIRLS